MALYNYMQAVEGVPKLFSMFSHRFMQVAVVTFAELGIADILNNAPEEGLTAETISVKDNLKVDLLYRVLRCCADAGLVKRVGPNHDRFILTSSGRLFITDDPSRARSCVRHFHGRWVEESLAALPDLVRQKTSIEEVQKKLMGHSDYYEWIQLPEQAEALAMEADYNKTVAAYCGNALVTGIDFSRFRSIVDCGGNDGSLVAQILEHYDKVEHGIVFDLPSVTENTTNKNIELRHIDSKRYEFVGGDVFNVTTIPPDADAYIFKNILDVFIDDQVVAVLSNIRLAVCTRGKKQRPRTVFIAGMIILPEDSPQASTVNWQAHSLDLLTGVLTGAMERTVEDYKRLLEKAGLQFIKLHAIGKPESAIEASIEMVQ